MTVLKITKWEASGLRCPSTTVEVTANGSDEIFQTFIQMPNGHGKTTTHRLIQFALEEDLQSDLPYVIDSKGNKIDPEKWINGLRAKGKTNSMGTFTLYCELDGRALIIKVEFNFESSTFERTYTYGSVSGTSLAGQHKNVKDLISSRVSDFMMLDGERAKQFLDGTKSSAGDAIRRIHKIDSLDILMSLSNNYHMAKLNALGGKSGDASKIKAQTTILTKLTTKLNNLKSDRTEKNMSLKVKTGELKALEEEKQNLGKSSSKYTKQIGDIENKIKQKNISRATAGGKILLEMRVNPIAVNQSFANELEMFRSCLETNKLPESAGKEWFIELADMSSCVCGTKIEATQKQRILNRAENYLSGNHQTLLNQIKTSVRVKVDIHKSDYSSPRKSLNDAIKETTRFATEVKGLRLEKERLENQNAKELGIEANLEALVGKIIAKQTEIETIEAKLLELNDGVGNPDSIEYCEQEIVKCKEILREFRQAYEIVTKNELIENTLIAVRDKITTKICNDIRDRTNTRCKSIIGNDDMMLEKIEDHLIMIDSDTKQTGGSMGQELVLAYSFLEALYKDIDFEVPFLIDSPCGPLDKTNRNQIAELLWKLNRRTIIFIINTEKAEFIPVIRELAQAEGKPNAIKYITQFNLNDKTKKYYDKLDEKEKHSDSAYTESEEFFDTFEAEGEQKGDEE